MRNTDIDWIPYIPDDWEVVRLKDIAKLQSGEGITSDDIDEAGDYPVYGGNGLRGYAATYTNDGSYVLIGRQGALCGNINYAKGKFYASEHAVVVYTHDKCENTTWLGETLRMANFNRLSASAAQPGLAVSTLNIQKIPYPPKDIRKRIGDYLDAKLAAIDKRIAVLEKQQDAYARLKKSMIHQAVTRGLNPDVRLKDSGVEWIGMIPEHWEVKRIKDICNVVCGATPKDNTSYWDGNIIWISPADMPEFGELAEGNRTITEQGYLSCGTSLVPAGSIVMSTRAPIGKTNIAVNDLCTNQGCKCLTSNKLYMKFMLYSMWSKKGQFQALGRGTTFIELSTKDLSLFLFAVPPLSEQRAIANYLDEKCAKIDAAIENIGKQIDASKRLKRAIINEVISGKRMID